jgi:hypothetical protein
MVKKNAEHYPQTAIAAAEWGTALPKKYEEHGPLKRMQRKIR